jgi:hypothetical protein
MSISELSTLAVMARRLEPDRVNAAVDLRHTEDLFDLVLRGFNSVL